MKKNMPRVSLIFKQNGKVKHLYPSLRKAQKFLNSEAAYYIKHSVSITLRVSYGENINSSGKRVTFVNEGTYDTLTDLKWAFQAFVKDYIKD